MGKGVPAYEPPQKPAPKEPPPKPQKIYFQDSAKGKVFDAWETYRIHINTKPSYTHARAHYELWHTLEGCLNPEQHTKYKNSTAWGWTVRVENGSPYLEEIFEKDKK